ncbi:predicted protein [Nematostella vectensis]|uniref:Uncharacterized protein n=1 Tax=Nematostella vectensis TaxID=45351 RepID=A7SMH1_NEMVE|nr:predicted protein [Nematostella vectensis]|eukprot:XP_001627230.1 predicted protein [Nematostella vectensis]
MTAVETRAMPELVSKTDKLSIKCINSNTSQVKRRIKDLDKLYVTMQQQQEDVQYLLDLVLKWDEDFKKVVRFSQGVPHMRRVKEICLDIKTSMFPNGDFATTLKILEKEEIPGISRVVGLFEHLKSLLDEKAPNAKFNEEIRQRQFYKINDFAEVESTSKRLYFEALVITMQSVEYEKRESYQYPVDIENLLKRAVYQNNPASVLELENFEQVKLIETEAQKLQEIKQTLEERTKTTVQLEASTTKLDHKAKELHKLFRQNEEIISSLKKNNTLLNEHEESLHLKCDEKSCNLHTLQAEHNAVVEQYQSTWQNYKAHYERSNVAAQLVGTRDDVIKREKEVKDMEKQLKQLEFRIKQATERKSSIEACKLQEGQNKNSSTCPSVSPEIQASERDNQNNAASDIASKAHDGAGNLAGLVPFPGVQALKMVSLPCSTRPPEEQQQSQNQLASISLFNQAYSKLSVSSHQFSNVEVGKSRHAIMTTASIKQPAGSFNLLPLTSNESCEKSLSGPTIRNLQTMTLPKSPLASLEVPKAASKPSNTQQVVKTAKHFTESFTSPTNGKVSNNGFGNMEADKTSQVYSASNAMIYLQSKLPAERQPLTQATRGIVQEGTSQHSDWKDETTKVNDHSDPKPNPRTPGKESTLDFNDFERLKEIKQSPGEGFFFEPRRMFETDDDQVQNDICSMFGMPPSSDVQKGVSSSNGIFMNQRNVPSSPGFSFLTESDDTKSAEKSPSFTLDFGNSSPSGSPGGTFSFF